MAKRKIACAVTAAAIIAGSGLFTPIRSWAESIMPVSVVENEGVSGDPATAGVAMLGGESFPTLEAAIDKISGTDNDGEPWVIEVTGDMTTPGYAVDENTKLIIDLGGHTVWMAGPTVGSSGTETEDWQFLKNSDITLRNGTMVASSTERSKTMIQNYANLTLEDITLDGTTLIDGSNKWVVSIGNGKINVIGNTSIKAASDGHALGAMWWSSYPTGAQVNVDTNGIIDGPVQLNYYGNAEVDAGGIKSKMEIKKGTFTGEVTASTQLKDYLSVTGGTFAQDPSAYVDESHVVYQTTSETYGVAAKSAFSMNAGTKITLAPGETRSLNSLFNVPSNYPIDAEHWTVTLSDGWNGYIKAMPGNALSLTAEDKITEDKTFTMTISNKDGIIEDQEFTVTVSGGQRLRTVGDRIDGNTGSAGAAMIDFANALEGDDLALKVEEHLISEELLEQEPTLKAFYDISVVDAEGNEVPVKDNDMTITVNYCMDREYDFFQIAYVNGEGKLAEYIDVDDYHRATGLCSVAENTPGYMYTITFRTNHLSGYGAEAADEEFEEAEIRNAALANTPDTGALTGSEETSSLDTTALVVTVIVMTLATAGMEFGLWKKRQANKN